MIGAVTIFTDAQAAIGRMTSDEPGPGQKYALEARKHIAALRAKEPGVKIEIRWCPSHQRVEGDKTADEWAKLAADEPDAHGVEWLSTTGPDGTVRERKFPLPQSLANVKRGFSEKKWTGPRAGSEANSPGPETTSTDPVKEPTENSLGDHPRGDQKDPWPHPGQGPHQDCGAAGR